MLTLIGRLGRLVICTVTLLSFPLGLWGQSDNGRLEGSIIDETGEAVAFANVLLLRNEGVIAAVATDENGTFTFISVPAGTYDLKITYTGKDKVIRRLSIPAGRVLRLPVIIFEVSTTTEEVNIVYERPPVRADEVGQTTIDKKEFVSLATRDISTAIQTASGVFSADDGRALNIRGGREGGTQIFVDGERVIGNQALTQQAVEQINLLKAGIPAEFGDATGGIISVTTSQSSPEHRIGIEGVTSQFLDPFGYNLIALTATGPLLKDKDPKTGLRRNGQSRIGYFLAGEYQNEFDRDPPNVRLFKLRDGLQDSLEQNPLRPRPGGRFFDNSASYLRSSDFERIRYKPGNGATSVRANGRLDFRVGRDSWLRFGASYEWNNQNIFDLTRYLFASGGNENRRDNTLRVFARFSQLFTDTSSKAILKSVNYQLQVSYTRFQQTRQANGFGDDFFKYGHVGTFNPSQVPTYEYIRPDDPRHRAEFSANGYWQTSGFRDTAYTFDGSRSSNPIQARYNEAILRSLQLNPRLNPFSFPNTRYSTNFFDFNDARQLGGIVNGDNTRGNQSLGVYSLFDGVGGFFNGYRKLQNEMIRLTGQATMQLGKSHNLKFGFEFDQRFERFFSISPASLWILMTQLANTHLSSLDTANPIAVRDPGTGVFLDTVRLNPLVGANQTTFDRNMRIKLGLNPNGADFVRPERYDPSFFSLDMFSANELFNAGKPLVTYYGYDFKGNITGQRPAGDFFSDLGNRPQNAFAPTYFAGYIEDKFILDRIIFSLGFRVDRLDLNQQVLRDKFVMRPFYTAGEVNNTLFPELPNIGSNIGGSWVPYVNSRQNPTDFLGFRDGANWYDKFGTPVSPRLLEVNGRVIPLLKQDSLTLDAFTDYKPQWNFMPRIAFSFPINDKSTFYASYDVLTQRPTNAQIGQFIDYLFIQQNATDAIANPNLRPERTVNYEVGFQQAISPKIGITISAFFREMRDMIQIVRNTNAYPITYDSFENVDFGTVKGFSAELQTLRLKIVQLRLAYTLQFATGTGSSFSSSRNALNGVEGFSLIRNELALTFDQRHTITGTFDLRWDDYRNKGPVIRTKSGKEIYPLKNFGINLTYTVGSGTPFTRNALPNPAEVQFGVNSVIQTQGQPLSQSLPWRFRLNLRVDKDFIIQTNKRAVANAEGTIKTVRPHYLNLTVYLLVLNLFDTQNILNVYRFSGLPNTSGYLDSDLARTFIQQQVDPQSFVDLYRVKETNPSFYSLPRRIRLGLQLQF